jgi:hypothetical protein
MAVNATRLGPLTTLKEGNLGDQPDAARDNMFVGPASFPGLAGIALGDSVTKRESADTRKPFAGTDFGDAARRRSCGGK